MSEVTKLPDGSAFAVLELELPEGHWLYGDESMERDGFEPPPMPFRMGTDNPQRREMAEMLRIAGKYALRASTLNGKEDFDPDAVLQNLIVGMLGYWTPDGLTDDEWANPL